jgi:hypothetical protein
MNPAKDSDMPTLSAKALKVSVVLLADEVLKVNAPDGGPSRTTLSIRTPEQTVKVDVASKSIRKAQSTIKDNDGNVAVIVQGRLVKDEIVEAGLTAQPKTPKAEVRTDNVVVPA